MTVELSKFRFWYGCKMYLIEYGYIDTPDVSYAKYGSYYATGPELAPCIEFVQDALIREEKINATKIGERTTNS
jgi:hypothetical protein